MAGYTTSADRDEYELYDDPAALSDELVRAVGKSSFHSEVEISSVKHAVLLSTCSYEYGEARYVVAGSLTPVEE